jgi:3-oxoacyl-[acyl-carrier protein] reductase
VLFHDPPPVVQTPVQRIDGEREMGSQIGIIFGSTGGIGSVVAALLRSSGWNVVLVGRNSETLSSLADSLRSAENSEHPGEIHVRQADVTNTEETEKLFNSIRDEVGMPTGVVNCVGSVLLKPAHLTSLSDFKTVLDVNLVSAFNIVRAAGKTMTEGGSVVLLSSCAARIGLPNHEAIAAAKAGIEGLARSAAASYASRRLRFNCVAPGLTRTPMTKRITASPQAEAASTALHPLGRLGEPHDIARAITYFLSPDSSWITGQTLGVDGGLAALKA